MKIINCMQTLHRCIFVDKQVLNVVSFFSFAGAMSPKFGDGHSPKRYAPELLAGVIFDVYDQHTQIVPDVVVKLNKWHVTIEKLYSKPTETEQGAHEDK